MALKIDLMRRQGRRGIVVIGDDHRGQEARVVEEQAARDIAAAGGNELQQRHRRLVAAVGQGRDRVTAKSPLEMLARPGTVAEIGKHGAEALMRLGMIRIGLQRALIMRARLLVA